MSPRIASPLELKHKACALVLGSLLVWQGGASALDLVRTIRWPRPASKLRFAPTDDERIRAILGDDYSIYRAVCDHVPAGSWVIARVRNTRDGRLLMSHLTNLLYPRRLALAVRVPLLVQEGALRLDERSFFLDLHLGVPLEIASFKLREVARGERFALYENEIGK